MGRKNILLITSDQQRWDSIGYNSAILKTPNLDALAGEGIIFDRAYTVNPTCTPARVSILTGQYPSRHGCYTIGTSLPDNYDCLVPSLLAQNGYDTSLIGKAHFQACGTKGSFESSPNVNNTEFFKQWSGPYYGFEHVQLSISHGNEKNAPTMHYGAWLEENGVDIKRYFGNGQYTDFGAWDLPEEYHYTKWTADKTIEAIESANSQDKPFFIWSSFQDPHNPCMVPQPWASMYDPEDMPVLGGFPGEFDDKPPFYRGLNEKWNYGDSLRFKKDWHCINTLPWMNDKKKKEITAMYYGMISLMDKHIGRIVDALRDKGLLDDTVIVFTTDHGDYLGNHGMWWKGLPAYEDIHKLPFFVRNPGCETPGAHSDSFQSLVDLGSTFLRIAGCELLPGIQGIDQSATWTSADKSNRDHCLIEFRPTEDSFMQKTFLYDKYKVVLYSNPEWGELYDLSKDPEQLVNLWNDGKYSSVRFGLIQQFIKSEMEKDGVLRERTSGA